MSTPGSAPKQVFISHSSDDKSIAKRICRLLEERGVSCWIAPRDITPGHDYGEEIIIALEKATALLLILSEHSNASRHVGTEVSRAFSKEKLVIPVRVANVMPSKGLELFVSSAHWVDAWKGSLEEKMDEVAASVREAAGLEGAACPRPRPSARRRPKGPVFATAIAALLVVAACVGIFLRTRDAGIQTRGAEPGVPAGDTGNAVSPVTSVVPRYHALVIGINQYATHAGDGWSPLGTARDDAEAIGDLLEGDYGFSVTRLLDAQATRSGVMAALDSLVPLTYGDAVLVYFAGHGYFDEALGEGYWIPSDARKTIGGRSAKEDWLWNSTISKILNASEARHVLVMADSCYSGSLFRGEEMPAASPDLGWYRRAITKPSRYLIASGDMEPVLDSGTRHSVFANQVLAYLRHTDHGVFCASDLGIALRGRVNEVTGQMVRIGPLAVSGDAGGEFVFVKPAARDSLVSAPGPTPSALDVQRSGSTGAPGTGPSSPASDRILRDALALGRAGATNAASRLLAASETSDDRLVRALVDHLDQDRRAKERSALNELVEALDKRKQAIGETQDPELLYAAKPRVLACIGPGARMGGHEAENLALLYRICLRADIEGHERMQVIEREALEEVLQEMNLGSSDLADARARTAIGKLLPAGMLLLGDLLPAADSEGVYLRLVDTETTRVLGSFSATKKPGEDIASLCSDLAARIVAKAVEAKPLTARAVRASEGLLRASVGRFHGASGSMRFTLLERVPVDGKSGQDDYRETVVGEATVADIGELTSDLTPQWTEEARSKPPKVVWVRELAGEPTLSTRDRQSDAPAES